MILPNSWTDPYVKEAEGMKGIKATYGYRTTSGNGTADRGIAAAAV
jgi:hypothetical protein